MLPLLLLLLLLFVAVDWLLSAALLFAPLMVESVEDAKVLHHFLATAAAAAAAVSRLLLIAVAAAVVARVLLVFGKLEQSMRRLGWTGRIRAVDRRCHCRVGGGGVCVTGKHAKSASRVERLVCGWREIHGLLGVVESMQQSAIRCCRRREHLRRSRDGVQWQCGCVAAN